MNPTAPLSLTDRFVLPLEGLYAAVAACYRNVGWTYAMIHLVCNRIRRVELRVLKLLALFLAGRLPPETAPVARVRPKREREAGAAAPLRIPRGYGWLIRMVPYVAAGYAGQLRLALADPQMMALLAASPKARRALAPVCRMLMMEPEVLDAQACLDEAPLPETSGDGEAATAKVPQPDDGGWGAGSMARPSAPRPPETRPPYNDTT